MHTFIHIFYVKLFDHLPHNVCGCSYHENIRLLLLALKDFSNLSSHFQGVIEQVAFDANSKNCMTRKCATYANSLEAYELTDSDAQLKYQQWENSEKVEITGTVREVFNKLDSKLTDFLLHTYIKRCQGSQFSDMKVKCYGRQVVSQVDFSENATLMSQN